LNGPAPASLILTSTLNLKNGSLKPSGAGAEDISLIPEIEGLEAEISLFSKLS
jgi:hypothetical protein